MYNSCLHEQWALQQQCDKHETSGTNDHKLQHELENSNALSSAFRNTTRPYMTCVYRMKPWRHGTSHDVMGAEVITLKHVTLQSDGNKLNCVRKVDRTVLLISVWVRLHWELSMLQYYRVHHVRYGHTSTRALCTVIILQFNEITCHLFACYEYEHVKAC